MSEIQKQKQSLRTRGLSNQLHPSHTWAASWWEVFTGRHNPRTRFQYSLLFIIYYYYYYYHGYNIHSLIHAPGFQTSTQSHVSMLWHSHCRSSDSPCCVRYRVNIWWFYTDSSWEFNPISRSALLWLCVGKWISNGRGNVVSKCSKCSAHING